MSAIPLFPSKEHAAEALEELPPLPSAFRYYDDYLERFHSIRDLEVADAWSVQTDGEVHEISFATYQGAYRSLMKHVAVDLFSRLDPTTVIIRLRDFRSAGQRFPTESLIGALVSIPVHDVRDTWSKLLRPRTTYGEAGAIKTILHSLCNLGIGVWRPDLRNYVSRLPAPRRDAYRVVRTGDCFVPLDQQSMMINYLDEVAAVVDATPDQLSTEQIQGACILIVAHQHGYRPGQIARIRIADVRTFNTGAVHLSVVLSKKWSERERVRVTRRMKREWCSLFVEFARRRRVTKALPARAAEDSFFGLTPGGVSSLLAKLVLDITGEDWSATDLRHTAGQRQVDRGISHVDFAEFMGHTSVRTGNVYFESSPTQAQHVNQALGLSPTYVAVAETARTGLIDKAALLRLPSDKQVGGAPHGIAIAGIGGCTVGQSICTKNPVLSCYNCRRFMPLADATVHEAVVECLRKIVLEFAVTSRGDSDSPAYTQLQRTIEAAMSVVASVRRVADISDE